MEIYWGGLVGASREGELSFGASSLGVNYVLGVNKIGESDQQETSKCLETECVSNYMTL